MRWPWDKDDQRRGAEQKKLLAEARKSGETMTVMVDRLDVLVKRLNQELERYERHHRPGDHGGGADS